MMQYGFDTFRFDRLIAVAQPANRRSIRMMEKLGMIFEKPLTYKGVEVVCYGKTNPATPGLQAEMGRSEYPERSVVLHLLRPGKSRHCLWRGAGPVGGHRNNDGDVLAAIHGGWATIRALSGVGELRQCVELRHLAAEYVEAREFHADP